MQNMVQLSDDQVDWVQEKLFSKRMASEDLESDLLDHFCCYIEDKMSGGMTLQESFNSAFEAIAPNGVMEIQLERDFLLNHDFQPTMKKILYISGFIFCFSFSLNLLFRQLQWESGLFHLMSFFSLVLFVLPSIAILAYRNRKLLSMLDKIRMVAGISSGMVIGVGMIFKSFHFPTANLMITLGTLAFAVVFLPIFFYQLYKRVNF